MSTKIQHAGVTVTKGKAEMAALQGVDVWWDSDVISAGRLPPGATIEQWLEASGMTYTFRKAKLMYYADRAQKDLRVDDDNVAIIRSDNGARMGIANASYNITQPFEMLEFFRDLVAGSGFELTTAGTLHGGKRMWALAKITEAVISGWDQIGAYLLLSSSADGSLSNEGRLTTVCVVCQNTMGMALAREPKAKVSHRVSMALQKLKAELGLETARAKFAAYVEAANTLSKKRVSDAAADEFVLRLLRGASADEDVQKAVVAQSGGDTLADLLAAPFVPKEEEQTLETLLRRPRGADAILALFEGGGRGSDQKGRKGTAWGLVNAVTDYTDHLRTCKSDDHRVESAWWGTGDLLKTDAMALALETFA